MSPVLEYHTSSLHLEMLRGSTTGEKERERGNARELLIEGREEREKFGKNLFYVLIWLGEESMRERRDAERERFAEELVLSIYQGM